MKLILFALMSIISTNTTAALPFTFLANQPAIADEVNQNFSFLDDKITQGANCSTPTNGVKFTYAQKQVPLGTVIRVGLNTFIIIKTSFIDIEDGTMYNLTIPAATSINTFTPRTVMSVSYKIIDPQRFCSAGEISGYPVNTMYFNANSTITYFAELSVNSIRFVVYKQFDILVGSTVVTFEVSASILTQSNVFIDSATSDYTRSFDPANMVAPLTFIQEMDALIDHIIIEKAP